MTLRWIDSHCHLNFSDFGEDFTQVLERAKQSNISSLISIACEMSEMDAVYTIAQTHECVYASVGIHPHEAKKDLDTYGDEAIRHELRTRAGLPKVVGLGETGLDYYYEHSPRSVQKELFNLHLDIAEETGLPVIIHTRDAEEDTIDILKPRHGKIKGVFHCFSGSQWLAEQALELGFYLSISGVATFSKADELRKTIQTIPLDRLLLETDAPYLAPVPKRGKRNEPSFMLHTASQVATLKEVSLEELSEATVANTKRLFQKVS